ncbi:MAG: BNR-4 repeat-containing protein, partial [Glaciecola sp.]
LYDMHRNGRYPIFAEDYLRYSYSIEGAASVSDEDFTLGLFVNSEAGHYKHLQFNGIDDAETTKLLTYPAFFTGENGDLFMKMRYGFSRNGKMLFARYDGQKWHGYYDFNRVLASQHGSELDWGLYGDFKYVGGKFRIAFQRRLKNLSDKFLYQDGIYYAFSNDPMGVLQWQGAHEQAFKLPLVDAELIKIAEPGDWVKTTKKDQVSISHGFDFTVTDREDEHFISQVNDLEFGEVINLHTYRKADTDEFKTVPYNLNGQLYTFDNNIYLVGLKSGRVTIAKAPGGTSNFEVVYQHDHGPIFDKGVSYVAKGKVYYFLKQAEGTGDTRTLYLQVFDLK